MKTKFIIEVAEGGGKYKRLATSNKKKQILADYQVLCERETDKQFRLVEQITSVNVIAESDDYRQARFDFVV